MLLKATCSERSEREPCDVGKTKISRGKMAGEKIAKSELPILPNTSPEEPPEASSEAGEQGAKRRNFACKV